MTLQTVHLRVNDSATQKPIPVRIRFTDSAGQYYAPLGRLSQFAQGPNQAVGGNVMVGNRAFAYIDGTCEINLPPGPLHVSIHKGPEFVPLETDLVLQPGKLSLRLALDRCFDSRSKGWFAGDARTHFIPPHAALLEAQGEDLAVVNVLGMETTITDSFGKKQPQLANLLEFSGQVPALRSELPETVVVVNTENRHIALGSLGLLNCHRVVYPLLQGLGEGTENWTLEDWCQQCHRKGGLVVWTNPLHETADFRYGEPLADLVLGLIDAFEISFFEDSPFDAIPLWYDLLQSGFKIPLAGASGKNSNGQRMGAMRTYAQWDSTNPDETKSFYHSWINAVRAGKTFVTNGPIIQLTVNGQSPGATIHSLGPLRLEGEAQSIVPFDALEIIWNGEVIAQASPEGELSKVHFKKDFNPAESGWIVGRCRGTATVLDRPAPQKVFAHTSPIYFDMPGKPFQPDPKLMMNWDREIQAMETWVKVKAGCFSDRGRERILHVFEMARNRLKEK